MENIDNLVAYVKSNLDTNFLKIVDFIERANLLRYSMLTEKVKEGIFKIMFRGF